jgi:hypothetical protein
VKQRKEDFYKKPLNLSGVNPVDYFLKSKNEDLKRSMMVYSGPQIQ